MKAVARRHQIEDIVLEWQCDSIADAPSQIRQPFSPLSRLRLRDHRRRDVDARDVERLMRDGASQYAGTTGDVERLDAGAQSAGVDRARHRAGFGVDRKLRKALSPTGKLVDYPAFVRVLVHLALSLDDETIATCPTTG